MRARFGGRLKALVSGGAPLNYEVGVFFTALGLRLLQGYGQTEAAPVVSCNPPSRIKLRGIDGLEAPSYINFKQRSEENHVSQSMLSG